MSIISNLLEVAKSLTVGLIDTPLDGRTRIDALTDIPDIENPFEGMLIYCKADKKTYIVKTLKAKTIGALTVQNALIDTYAEFGGASTIAGVSGLQAALDAKAPASHTHSGYALADHTHDYTGVFASVSHTHTGYAPASHTHTLSDLSDLSDLSSAPEFFYCQIPVMEDTDILTLEAVLSDSDTFSSPENLTLANGKVFNPATGNFITPPESGIGMAFFGSVVRLPNANGKKFYRYRWKTSGSNPQTGSWHTVQTLI